jgi:hypothetical protein
MISRFRTRRGRATTQAVAPNVEVLFAEIAALTAANAATPSTENARRMLELRHRAGLALIDSHPAEPSHFASPAYELLPADSVPAEVAAADLTPELLRAAILTSGCLLVRGLVSKDEAARLVGEIDRAYEARDEHLAGGLPDPGYFSEFEPDPRFDLSWERKLIIGGAGLWGADSPRVMVEVLGAFERAGLRRLATEYLGERNVISLNKCLLRRVSPELFAEAAAAGTEKPSAWHQDGAFLGGVRALNVWLSLSRCGDEAPGLDMVPRRLDRVVPTGTEGAANDWSVSWAVAQESAGDVGIVRPIFEPGDVLLFDELFLHATAADPVMPRMRYAVETWFFGCSAFPANYAPLAL